MGIAIMYFIVMRGESFLTNKIGHSDGVALKTQNIHMGLMVIL